MRKKILFFAATLMSVCIFAQQPTKADLTSYMKSEHYVACFSTPENAICNDIVWPGSYLGSSWDVSDMTKLVRCQELPNFPGWYVAVVPLIYDIEGNAHTNGKPVQLSECGTFDWDYQCGGPGTITLIAGKVDIVNNGEETDLNNWSTTEPTIINMTAWKNNPCGKTCSEGQYTIRVIAPECEEHPEFVPYVCGSFNSWGAPVKMIANGSYYEYTTPMVSSNLQFKFSNSSTKNDWTNQFVYYITEEDIWADFDNFTLDPKNEMSKFYTREGNVLTFDFSDQRKFRYKQCPELPEEEPTSLDRVEIGELYYNLDIISKTAEVTFKGIAEPGDDYGNYYLTKVDIPTSIEYKGVEYNVTSIAERAFESSRGLTTIVIPKSVTSIGWAAFSNCSSLTSITIPNSVTSIAMSTFSGCSNLASVTIPNSITSIEQSAFLGCSSLTSITIPNSVTSIGGSTFSGCSSLMHPVYNVHIFAYLPTAYIGAYAIPDGIEAIASCAFSDCSSLASVTIPNSVTSIGSSAFSGCSSLASVTIPNSVTSIGGSAFRDCFSLAIVTIPNSITNIGDYAFYNCTGLTSVTIPNSVTSIGKEAFTGCSSLTSITIPNNVIKIEHDAFRDCSSLTSVIWNAKNCADKGYFGGQVESFTFGNEVELIPAFCCNGMNKLTSIDIPNSVTSIGNEAFNGCSGLTNVIIGKNVTSIGQLSFDGCSSLTEITIPNSVTSIGWGAFENCSSLTSVVIGNNVKSIEDYAFRDCSSLTSVIWNAKNCADNGSFGGQVESFTFGNEVELIPAFCCNGMNKLTSINFPNSVTSIGDDAFGGCFGQASIEIPNSVTSIGDYAFNGVYNIIYYGSAEGAPWGAQHMNMIIDGIFIYEGADKSKLIGITDEANGDIVIPEQVTTIGAYAFASWENRWDATITVPNTVTEIGEGAFDGVYNVIYSGTAEGAPWGAQNLNRVIDGIFIFNGLEKTNLVGITDEASGDIVIPDNVTTIGAYAFENLRNRWETITIPNTVTEIGEGAFNGVWCIYYYGNAEGSPWGAQHMNLYKEGWLTYSDNTKTHLIKCSSEATGKIDLPNSVRTITDYTFSGCDGITEPVYNDYLFAFMPRSFEGKYSIPEGIKLICESAFYRCSKITEIILPESLQEIGEAAFVECEKLANIHLPQSLLTIGEEAFVGCFALSTISIPKNVREIGELAFYAASERLSEEEPPSALVSINVDIDNPYYASQDGVLFNKSMTKLIQYPMAKPYKSYVIPQTVDSIWHFSFTVQHNLTQITIPSNVRYVGYEAFDAAFNLTKITFNEGLKYIEDYAFARTKIESVILPHSLDTIGRRAFSGCKNLKELVLGKGIKYIRDDAFNLDTANIKSVTCYAENVPNIEERAFYVQGEVEVAYVQYETPWGIEEEKVEYYLSGWSEEEIEEFWVGVEQGIYNVVYRTENAFMPSLLTIFVPSQSVEAYKADENWGQYNIQPISAQPADVEQVEVKPTETSVEIQWPSVVGAASYELIIKDEKGKEICTLVFNANGQLTSLMFHKASLNRGVTEMPGFSFVVTGLDRDSKYFYSIKAKDAEDKLLDTQEGTFYTLGEKEEQTYVITVKSADEDMGTVKGSGTYAEGAKVTIEAIPNDGYMFVQWNDGNTERKRSITVTADATYTAEFTDISEGINAIMASSNPKIMKFIRDGHLLILRDGVMYNAQGARVE